MSIRCLQRIASGKETRTLPLLEMKPSHKSELRAMQSCLSRGSLLSTSEKILQATAIELAVLKTR